jgi:hypothetical protein
MVSPLPESCGIAFKEWASVCDALLAGRQTIILRKGGISEGTAPGAFAPEHSEFWLYPTWVHQAEQGVRADTVSRATTPPSSADETVPIRGLVRVAFMDYVEDEEVLPTLAEHHILTAETVSKRFHYRKPGLWVLGARVWRREASHFIAVLPEHAGCKTWVEMAEPLSTSGLEPVLDDNAWALGRATLQVKLGRSQSTGPLAR